jgi:hypothetical protein
MQMQLPRTSRNLRVVLPEYFARHRIRFLGHRKSLQSGIPLKVLLKNTLTFAKNSGSS